MKDFKREKLAQLARETMLAVQINSRTGYAGLQMNHGQEAYKDIAIDNWMAASPVYTQRMQAAMHLRGASDVETIFKGLQLDCGLAHQYFDAGFAMDAAEEGRFWLNCCGALLEAEPRGEDAVRVMCHDIEDPTFDATAMATNPRARIRPIHRPPRIPANRSPHCEWRVFIDEAAEPLKAIELTQEVRDSLLAALTLDRMPATDSGGMDYYDGDLFEVLELERFSQPALAVLCGEFAVQMHLLSRALGLTISQHYGESAALDVAEFQMTGSAWAISERLANWLHHPSGSIQAIAEVLSVHPAFRPVEYITLKVHTLSEHSLRLELMDCAALRERDAFGWIALLARGRMAGLEALVQGVDPRARVSVIDGEGLSWEVSLNDSSDPVEPPLPVQIAKGSVVYRTELENSIPLLQFQD